MSNLRSELLAKLEELTVLVLTLPEEEEETGGVDVGDGLPALDNQAEDYGVKVNQPDIGEVWAKNQTYYRCVEVQHLTPVQNRGGHQIYVRVQDEYGNRVYDNALRIGWTWQGRRPNEAAPPVALDKPDRLGERGHGNLDLYLGQRIELYITSTVVQVASDVVYNIHSDHPGEPAISGEIWNSVGHHSFVVTFVKIE